MSSELSELFPQFDAGLIEDLEKVGQLVDFEEGDVLIRPGQYLTTSLLILDGHVKIYREGGDGDEIFLYFLEQGNSCALSMICSINNEVSSLKGVAMTKGKALLIPVQHMELLVREHRQWMYFLLETYRSKFNELIEVVDQVVFDSMDKKLESYLERMFETSGNKITITHQEIANDLNSSREVISRLLKKLESQKRISISRFEITRLNF
ncbi:Crp/Fnr family transcriptional regulator [Cytophagales bacterium WSM2-2]|nr:Crp/Fnr family transcriptional regulator [Cytophagales bacterium WSM2-2]